MCSLKTPSSTDGGRSPSLEYFAKVGTRCAFTTVEDGIGRSDVVRVAVRVRAQPPCRGEVGARASLRSACRVGFCCCRPWTIRHGSQRYGHGRDGTDARCSTHARINPTPERSSAVMADERYIALITFRRDGTPKRTSVWPVDAGDGRIGFITSSKTWKAKRIGNNNRVAVQPFRCQRSGGATTPTRTLGLPTWCTGQSSSQ